MTPTGGQGWHAPTARTGGQAQPAVELGPVVYPPPSWWFVTWRARVLEESTGRIEARLSAVAEAMGQLDQVGGLPGVHLLASSSVTFEFWYEATTAKEAFGGARAALRQAFKAAGVGDPTPLSSRRPVDVMLMLEELPALQQDAS